MRISIGSVCGWFRGMSVRIKLPAQKTNNSLKTHVFVDNVKRDSVPDILLAFSSTAPPIGKTRRLNVNLPTEGWA
jgi:hypothetical protein